MRFQFRFNADDTRVTQINGDTLQIDIKPGSDIKDALKDVFNGDKNWTPKEPGKGSSFDEVMADEDMSGKDFVANMERLNLFSFSGKHGDKLRKDVIYMYDHSEFMKDTMRSTLQEHDGKKAFNFSTIGRGGGTISEPFDDLSTSVNTGSAYDGMSNENYAPEDNLAYVEVLAHEMVHSFLEVGDRPTMDIAEEIFTRELGAPVARLGPAGGLGGASRIGYDDDLLGATIDLDADFDVDRFMEDARNGDLDDMSHQEIIDAYGGGRIGQPALKDSDAFEDTLNGVVESIRSGVDVDRRLTPYMEGNLADRYEQLLDYNLRTGDYDNWEDLAKDTEKQLMDRLGDFPDEADVFAGYLSRHGGADRLKDLAHDAWNQFNNIPMPSIADGDGFDNRLNGLVEKIRRSVNVDRRTTLYMEGDLADRYQELLEYNLYHGDYSSAEELSEATKEQFMDRLGNFADEADVFAGYLSRHGGNEQLDKLANETWQNAYQQTA
jgi:hypothetical protein